MCLVFSDGPLIQWQLIMFQAKDKTALSPVLLNLQIIKLGCAACQVLPEFLPICLAFGSQAVCLHKIQTSICCWLVQKKSSTRLSCMYPRDAYCQLLKLC